MERVFEVEIGKDIWMIGVGVWHEFIVVIFKIKPPYIKLDKSILSCAIFTQQARYYSL